MARCKLAAWADGCHESAACAIILAAGAAVKAQHASRRPLRHPCGCHESELMVAWLVQDAAAPAPYQATEYAAAPAPYQATEYAAAPAPYQAASFAAQSGGSEGSPAGEAQGSSSIQAEAANQPAYQSWTQQQAPTFGLVGPFP